MSAPPHAGSSAWRVVLIALVVCAVLACAGVAGLVVWVSNGPEGGVRLTSNVESYAQEYIQEHRLLEPEETIVAYYDASISLDGSESAILTTGRLLYDHRGHTTSIPVGEIVDVQERDAGILGNVIDVVGRSGTRIQVTIAPLSGWQSFHGALLDAWRARTGP